MKVNYNFISSIRNFLINDNWRKPLLDRIELITKELERSVEDKFTDITSKWIITRPPEKVDALRLSLEKKAASLLIEKQEIEACLAQNIYKLGVAPFDINNAKLLLANVHILDLSLETIPFNPSAVSAVRGMLSSNFDSLYDLQVSNISRSNVPPILDVVIMSTITKLLQGEGVTITDLVDEGDELTQEEKEIYERVINNFNFVNMELLRSSLDIMKFIGQFYLRNNEQVDILSKQSIILACYFDNMGDIESFLSKINYQSLQTIETDVSVVGFEKLSLADLTQAEMKIWYQINATYGKEGLKLFTRAADIKAAKFDVVEELGKVMTVHDLYPKLREVVSLIRFSNEDDNLDIANFCYRYNIPERIFDKIVTEILPDKKTEDDLPEISFSVEIGKSQAWFEKLPAGDSSGLFLGKMTGCCQFIGGDAELSVIDGFTKRDAGFYVIKNVKGVVRAQSYAWIGVNKNEERVLVLDSYEHWPEEKQYFIPIMQKLLTEIGNFGFTELYVGVGGNTPKLGNVVTSSNIAPRDESLYRYMDSKTVYKITDKVALQEEYQLNWSIVPCENFEEFLSKNPVLNWRKLESNYSALLTTLDSSFVDFLKTYSNAINHLVSGSIISFLEIISLFEGKNFIIELLSNNSRISLEKRLNIISKILKLDTSDDPFSIYKLSLFNGLNPTVIELIDVELLVNLYVNYKHIPSILYLNTTVSPELSVSLVQIILDKFRESPEILEKILYHISNIDQGIIEAAEPKLLVDICSRFEYLPAMMSSHSTEYSRETKVKFASHAFTELSGNADSIVKLLITCSLISQEIIDKADFNVLVELCMAEKFPTILQKYYYTEIDYCKKQEIVDELLKYPSSLILKIDNGKLCSATLGAEEIHNLAVELGGDESTNP